MKKIVFAALVLAVSLPAAAALSPRYAEWPRTAVQWLMTPQDRQEWKAVTTDAAAEEFIRLFWARRDPTPGTSVNETKEEFDRRVARADALFRGRMLRGSLTQPGRVFILLGEPDYQNASLPSRGTGIESSPHFDSKGNVQVDDLGAQTSSSYVFFEYRNPMHHGLTNGHVSFGADPVTREYLLLVDRNNVTGALENAARGLIVTPALRTVPSWAVGGAPAAVPPAGEGQAFRVFLAIASNQQQEASAEVIPADVQKAISDLKGFLPYSSYHPIDSLLFRCRSGRPWSVELRGPEGRSYLVRIGYTAMPGGKLNVTTFDVTRTGDPADALLSTSFSITPGETISVGASKVGATGDALVFFVTAMK